MSIYNRQYQKVLAAEFLRYFLLGQSPDINDINKRIGDALDKRSNVTYKYLPQAYKEVFNNKLYNSSIRKIKFDIDTLHEEILDLFSKAAERLNFADLFYKVNNYELNKLEKELLLLLFINKQGDFYFDGFFDTFSDSSKIDSSSSTKDIIDLSEQCLSLPYGGKNTKRIDVGQLASSQSTTLTLSKPSSVISSNQIINTRFGNIFTDILAPWGHEIILTENIPFEITFTFPLNQSNELESEYFVNRFEIIPHSIKKQYCLVKISNDDVNYLSIKGAESEILLDEQGKTYAIDFETNLVQYVRLTLSKKEADEEVLIGNEKRYKYIFGLKKFASFQTGRVSRATYISKPITFKNTEDIGKVSIEANQNVPQGTTTNYYIATIDSSGKESSFIPISTPGSESNPGASKVLTFNNNIRKETRFTSTFEGDDAPQVYGQAFQGKEFYRIGPRLTNKPIYGTSSLFRGFKSWFRDYSGSFELITINDNYVSFEQTDTESLYVTTTEVPQLTVPPLASDGIKRVQLSVSRTPYYDSARGHLIKPQPGTQNISIDTRPNYAIYRVLQRVTNYRRTNLFTLGSSRTQYLPSSNFIIQSNELSQLPIIRSNSGTLIYTQGVDYTFELIEIGGRSRPTGRIIIPNGSAFLNSSGGVISLSLEFVYTIDPDITHKVTSISNNLLTLEHCSNTQYDSIEVTYRYIPTAPSQIINSSIRVSNLPSTSASRIFYVEGRDYVVDPPTGAIQRIPTGEINTKGSVYVQFSYRGSSSILQTFTTWAYIASTEGAQIKFDLDPTTRRNTLVVNSELGESFYVNTKQGLVNLTKAAVTPVLPNGWVQFIVRSRDPSNFTAFRSNLIDQVIQLKDINKKKIFRPFNFYFNEITAFRDAMSEKTLNHLKVNTLLSDHTVFAIDSTTDLNSSYIVINFKPNETTELYNKVPTEDADETNPPQLGEEDFVFVYTEKADVSSAPKQLKVKIELSRNNDTDGGVTPKVFDYQVRVGS